MSTVIVATERSKICVCTCGENDPASMSMPMITMNACSGRYPLLTTMRKTSIILDQSWMSWNVLSDSLYCPSVMMLTVVRSDVAMTSESRAVVTLPPQSM